MRAVLLLLVLCPAILSAQVTANAPADAAAHTTARQGIEKSIADLQRREKQVLLDFARIWRDSDPQGLDLRFMRDEGEQRRPRVQADELWIARLDSIRRQVVRPRSRRR